MNRKRSASETGGIRLTPEERRARLERSVRNTERLEELHGKMSGYVRTTVFRILARSGNGGSSDDVCQQFWMHLWKLGPAYWTPQAVNLISRQTAYKWLTIRPRQSPPIIDRIDECQEPRHRPSEILPDIEKVASALQKLPGEQRAVFAFRFQMDSHEELTFREIGRRLGITPGYAAFLFHQARKNLRMILEVKND